MKKIEEFAPQPNRTKMKKIHIIGISYLFIVKIALIVAIVYLAHTLVIVRYELQQEINKTRGEMGELGKQINDNQRLTQEQIAELRKGLLSTKEDLTTQMNELKAETSLDFSGVISEAIKAVVSIRTDVSQGSGFIVSPEGYIVTNAHVLSGGRYVQILTYENYESDQWTPAQLIGYDGTMDIAVLKVSGDRTYLEFANSDEINIGEKAIAIGNPYGLAFSVTEGTISQVNRQGPNELPAYLQIDVPLNRGNSGGPLINKKGKVIGINNFKLADSESLGFALESNYGVNTINKIMAETNQTARV